MFGKETKKRIADLEAFEKGICKIIDGYFATNEQAEVRYSMDNAVDKFWHFVKSVDDRLKRVAELEKENTDLRNENSMLSQEIIKTEKAYRLVCEDKDELEIDLVGACEKKEQLPKKIDEQQAVINAQEKEIQELRKPKTATAKGGKK